LRTSGSSALSALDATLRAILEQFNRCWHRRLNPSDRAPQQCLTSTDTKSVITSASPKAGMEPAQG
jgi:hypothetical protein